MNVVTVFFIFLHEFCYVFFLVLTREMGDT